MDHRSALITQLRAFGLGLMLMALPFAAKALGLGPATVHSALGRPLDVTIPLLPGAAGSGATVTASLAPPAAFQQAGIPYPEYAEGLRFSVGHKGRERWIRVSTSQPINDPIVEFVLHVQSGGTALERGYALLLNTPPVPGRGKRP